MDIFAGDNLINLIKTVGYFGIFGIVFAESGLFFGFFLPGDSLLVTAGILSSQGFFNIFLLLIITFVAAVLGDNVGYMFGKKVGPKIFNRKDSLLFKKENLLKAQAFYEKHGSKTIVLARFVPVVRTFAPIVAGAGEMHYSTFFKFNIIGGFLWSIGLTLVGFFFGSIIPNPDKYLLPVIAVVVLLSISPAIFEFVKSKLAKKETT